ncbi:MAG: hypothetical protein RLZ81_3067, partial [Pseudomonadota bacterium]
DQWSAEETKRTGHSLHMLRENGAWRHV